MKGNNDTITRDSYVCLLACMPSIQTSNKLLQNMGAFASTSLNYLQTCKLLNNNKLKTTEGAYKRTLSNYYFYRIIQKE